jgi:hypothetical protein
LGLRPDRPDRNFEERENLTCHLYQQPGHDAVGNRNFVSIARFNSEKNDPESMLVRQTYASFAEKKDRIYGIVQD